MARRLDTPGAAAEAMLDPQPARPRPVATDLRWLPALLALLLLSLRFVPDAVVRWPGEVARRPAAACAPGDDAAAQHPALSAQRTVSVIAADPVRPPGSLAVTVKA